VVRVMWRRRSVALSAIVGAVLLALTSMPNVALAFGEGTALIMTGTGRADPPPEYVAAVGNTYIDPLHPAILGQLVFPGYTPAGLTTPEQFWPMGELTFNNSVAEGVAILHEAITQIHAGEKIAVFGYSQSATIASIEMMALAASGSGPDPGQLGFVLIGNPNNPDGGILERLVGFYIPLLDVVFNGSTPPDTVYPTAIYSVQYDGITDFPQFPLNLAATLNALLGYSFVHGAYPFTPEGLSVAQQLAVSPGYAAGGGVTDYYMITTQNLPLLEPLRQIPNLGQFLADLLQPDLRVLVDLGYGDGYADTPTPASLIGLFDPFAVAEYLVRGLGQGWQAALVGAGLLAESYLPDAYPYLPSVHGLSTSLEVVLADLFGHGGPLPTAATPTDFGADLSWPASALDLVA
jgi:hypothetical protein